MFEIAVGKHALGAVRVKVDVSTKDDKRVLSMTGTVGAPSDPVWAGQCTDALRELVEARIPAEVVARMADVWDAWHMNDLRAACEHQRATWGDLARKVEVVEYGLTPEAHELRKSTLAALAQAALKGEILPINATARALAELDDWFKARHVPPDADSPLSGCFEVRKREQKAIGLVYPAEHPDGVLLKPCETCGYKYGNAWLYEPLPEAILQEIESWRQYA